MLYNHFTEELLGLQGVKITNVEQEENLIIHLEMERKRHNCICCGTATDTIHDYRLQKIKDIPSFGKNVVIMLRKRRYRLPKVLSIDEFKGNTWGEKYQCILTDPENKIVLDILPERYKPYLTTYFCKYPKEKREKVKYFVLDMWRTYYDTAGIWFKNAIRIVDKYHWIRQVIWAFENVRKEEQKKFSKTHRRYFKNSKKLLLKRINKSENEQQQQGLVMAETSVNLSRSHWYKEKFLEILDCNDRETAKEKMQEWIYNASNCGIPQFEKCADSMQN